MSQLSSLVELERKRVEGLLADAHSHLANARATISRAQSAASSQIANVDAEADVFMAKWGIWIGLAFGVIITVVVMHLI